MSVEIIYAEASPRPRPSEVTYVPRSPLREYDYYVIVALTVGVGNEQFKLLMPMFLEDLTYEYEFGAKTFIDKSVGFGIPVFFISIAGREQYAGYAASSACTTPITLKRDFWNLLKDTVEGKASKSIAIELSAPDFWDEMQEARVTYAPTVASRFLHRPLMRLSELVLRSSDEEEEYRLDAGDENFWKALRWREHSHMVMYSLNVTDDELEGIRNEELSLNDFASTLQAGSNAYQELIRCIDGCTNIEVHVIMPMVKREFIDILYKYIEERGDSEIPVPVEIETLFYPVLGIAVALSERGDRSSSLNLHIHYDDKAVEEIVLSLAEELEAIIKDMLGVMNFRVHSHRYSVMFSRISADDVELNEAAGGNPERRCIIIAVRDTNKRFLLHFIRKAMGLNARRVSLIYVPSEARIHMETFNSIASSSCLSHHNLRLNTTGMPSTGVLLLINRGYRFIESCLRQQDILHRQPDRFLYDCMRNFIKAFRYDELKALIKAVLASSRLCPLTLSYRR